MYKHILIPTDGSPLSEAAARKAVAFAQSINARLTGLTVERPFPSLALEAQMTTDTEERYQKNCEARAEKYLGAIKKLANANGVQFEGVHAFSEYPYQEIIRTAERKVVT